MKGFQSIVVHTNQDNNIPIGKCRDWRVLKERQLLATISHAI